MNLYRFKTFRTSYYFPTYTKKKEILYSLYTPFGRGKLSKWAWWMFKHIAPCRWMMKCSHPNEEFPYDQIKSMCPENSELSFNMGTPGDEQKISVLGIDSEGNYFFAKYSQKEKARELSRNEIYVLNSLKELNITPKLLEHIDNDEFVFFRTTCVNGKNPTDKSLNQDVWSLLKTLDQYHLPTHREFNGLKSCLSHGDFTPWNMIVEEGKYRLIDWEMAEERPLGFDVFTFTLVQEMLLNQLSPKVIVKKYADDYSKYFASWNILDYTPYLQWYAKELSEKYTDLKELL